MTTAQTGATVAADRVDLVDEDNAGRVLLGLVEHIAYPRGTDANEHFHEVRTGNGKKWHLGLAGNCLGEQGLAGTRRTDHQHAAGNLAAQALELARVTQELDQLGDLLLGLLDAGHIGEGDLDLVLAQHARLALAE